MLRHAARNIPLRRLCTRTRWKPVTTIEGLSWVSVHPSSQTPRLQSRALRWAGNPRAAHAILSRAGAAHSRDEKDLLELLLVLLATDEFTGPRQRLNAMSSALASSPSGRTPAAYNILLTACAREAARVSDNSSVKRGVILRTARAAWEELLAHGRAVDPRNVALMYRVAGECKDLPLARGVREVVSEAGDEGASSEMATAAYILCLGKNGRAAEAEGLFFGGPSHLRASESVLCALFLAYVAASRIGKAEGLLAVHGAGFLTLASCNAFVKQCAALRLHETAVEFVGRMARGGETGFPRPMARTYNLLLRGLSAGTGAEDRAVAADRALVVVEQMRAEGIAPTTVTVNSLIRSLVFRDAVNEAFTLYRAMEGPNRITFSHLMQGAAKVGDMGLAREALEGVRKGGERPNYGFCKSYLEIVAKVQGIDRAFEEARRLAIEFGESLVFGDVGSHEAVRMALISACGKAGDVRKAFDALHVRLAVHGSEKGDGDLAPLYVATVLMQVCLQCGTPGRGLEVFYSLKDAGLAPNFEVYESLIYGLCAYVCAALRQEAPSPNPDNPDDADWPDVWQPPAANLPHAEGEPSPEDALRVAVALLAEMHAAGEGRALRQAAYVYNTLISAAAAVDDFHLALHVFHKMAWRNNPGVVYFPSTPSPSPPPPVFAREIAFPAATVGTYNSMIAASWRVNQPAFAFHVFDTMLSDRVTEPNAATLALLADIALAEPEAVPTQAQTALLAALDAMPVLSAAVRRRRVRLRQKLLALRWS